ncbi:protein OXIDATIVE STRESS 3 LIKE 1 [Oryza sativa Japonica Group]|uniref:Os02g0778700 protein n=8 Tax=Oryza TaxID=4527 RepID=A0A0P0VQF1_ORYSJ|nr:uncharacterized protein LOC9272552 [Oryza sativa Japonica Group]XP_052141593.1 protein OXIDATIVE STRESS 3 LIKE 1-like [Oryza glaberrima]EAZ07842.1 hypothetical protein OsI_30100 [Oryza sativa Indica Group]KAB8089163.1 hypothetical protein EE612_014018 [Oryza sativa]EEE57906.1 hypothetical protein OsJ_08595 [Oryza sativa Japonica Group]KAF2947244.1 hypothetical protein DAI22_02g355100 [Oryza sativa Japonica Group]BAD19514.1 unknown protein [Oryza sativa Japonica Group]
MSIALESGPGLGGGGGGGGGPRFGRVARCAYAASPPPASVGARSSSSVGRDSDSPAAAAKWEWDGEEVEGGDGEVQSSYKGPFDTMDALQEALPFRKGVCKFYNGKSGSFAKLQDSVIPSPPEKSLPKPENPSPRKRKGLLPFSFKWGKPQNKEVFPEDDVIISPTNCRRMTLSPAATSSSGSNSGSDDEHYRSPKLHTRQPLRRPSNAAMGVFASPPAPRPPQVLSAHMRSHSMLDLQDVTESTAMVSPRDKRRRN